jgi:hypothetical protein
MTNPSSDDLITKRRETGTVSLDHLIGQTGFLEGKPRSWAGRQGQRVLDGYEAAEAEALSRKM